MLHGRAYAVAQQEVAVPRRILPGAPLDDAAPRLSRRQVLEDVEEQSYAEDEDDSGITEDGSEPEQDNDADIPEDDFEQEHEEGSGSVTKREQRKQMKPMR
jgi:hypothetical protein